MTKKNVDLKIKNGAGEDFHLSNFEMNSFFTSKILENISSKEIDFYLISEIKGTLEIEGEGSSRKIIKNLVSGKWRAKNKNEQKAINLYSVMKFINQSKPIMNKVNLMIIYNMLKMDIDMDDNDLENDLDYRQSDEEGFIGNIKTPSQSVMRDGMQNLFHFINSDLMFENPIEKALLIQVIFIYFHPFYDFNGRTGRLLTYWYLNIHGLENLSNLVYMALPENKKKYILMFEAMRKFKWSDLTTFLSFLKLVITYGVKKNAAIKSLEFKKGFSFNSTEKLIMFYLMNREDWILVNDLDLKINLGISKQGIHNAIASLSKKSVVTVKKNSNKLFVTLKNNIIEKDTNLLKLFYIAWTKDMSISSLKVDKIKN